jgi:hypothetical protein
MSRGLRRSRRRISPALKQRDSFAAASVQDLPLCLGRKRAVKAGLCPPVRGRLYCPVLKLLSTTMRTDRRQAVLVALSWSNTADLTIAAETCKGIPIRMHRHSFVPQKGAWCVSATAKWAHSDNRPRPRWGAHVVRRARTVAVSEPFSSPPSKDSGSRRLSSRSRRD